MVEFNKKYMKKLEMLEEIEKLFFEKSFDQVSMQDVANILKIKKASLYYHFKSKEEMILEVLDMSFEKYLEFILKTISEFNVENFKPLLKRFLNFSIENKNIFSNIHQNWYKWWDDLQDFINLKQKIIFDAIYEWMWKKLFFSKEKVFLFLVLISQIWSKNHWYTLCEIDFEKTILEIENLFFNK